MVLTKTGDAKPKIDFKCIQHGVGLTYRELTANLDGSYCRVGDFDRNRGVAADFFDYLFQWVTLCSLSITKVGIVLP